MEDNTTEQKQGDPLLIDLVRQFPCLYDKQLKEYRNNTFRDSAWNAIGQIMNMQPSECSKRWGQLRESFAREKRRREDESKSGSGLSQRRGFSLYNDMIFLEAHYVKRRTFSNVPNTQNKLFVHDSNTGSPLHYESLSANSIDDTEKRRQYMARCLAKSLYSFGLPLNATTTQIADATLLPPPPDLTPPATYPPPTIHPPATSTSISVDNGSEATLPIEASSVVNLHHIGNTLVSSSSATTLISPTPVISPSTLHSVESETPTASGIMLMPSSSVAVRAEHRSATTTVPHSPATLLLASPIRTTTPVSVQPQIILSPLSSPATSTPPTTTPTPPPRTPTPFFYNASPSASITVSTNASDSSISSSPLSPMPIGPRDDQFPTTPNRPNTDEPQPSTMLSGSSISNNRFSSQQRISTTSRSAMGLHCVAEPSACYNKKMEKQKKNDPIESSFLRLSSVIEDHLTNQVKKEETVKKIAAPRNDEAFVSLILAELSNFDEPTKVVKKAKLLQVLYEQ